MIYMGTGTLMFKGSMGTEQNPLHHLLTADALASQPLRQPATEAGRQAGRHESMLREGRGVDISCHITQHSSVEWTSHFARDFGDISCYNTSNHTKASYAHNSFTNYGTIKPMTEAPRGVNLLPSVTRNMLLGTGMSTLLILILLGWQGGRCPFQFSHR